MGDVGDDWRAWNAIKRDLRERLGVECAGCRVKEPKRSPSILLPQQRCKVCGYRDPRPRAQPDKDANEAR